MKRRLIVLLAAALASAAWGASPDSPAEVTVKGPSAPARAGERVEVSFKVDLLPDWHIYAASSREGAPFTVAADPSNPFATDGALAGPPPLHRVEEGLEMDLYEDQVTLTQAFRIPAGTPPGTYTLKGTYEGQACDPYICVSIDRTAWEAAVEVEAGIARTDRADAPPAPPPPTDGVRSALAQGLIPFLLAAVGAGLLTLLTPCVFPMIPVTISFFTKQASSTRGGAVKAAAAYAAGIILIYTGLGLGLSFFLKEAEAANRFGAHWAVNGFIAAVFIVFAFSLFGAFELTLPSGLMSRVTGRRSSTLPGILFLGLTFSLTSFTCSVQFVGIILAIAATGAWFWPVVGLLAFSTTLAAPFFLLALFPQALKNLPQRGGWLNSVKVVMGFVELAAAFKFLSSVDLYFHQGDPWMPRSLILVVWIVISAATALYLLGKIRLPHDDAVGTIGAGRMVLALFFLAFAGTLCLGVGGNGLPAVDAWLPPREAWEQVPKIARYEEALAQAKATGKPLFLNFTGIT